MREKDNRMKILYPFNGIAAVCFPVGLPKDGGTCEFATKKCLKYCEAMRPIPIKKDMDKITTALGVLDHVSNSNYEDYNFRYNAYKFITENKVDVVVERFKKEMEEMGKKILYWFKTGDCMKKHHARIYTIIKKIHCTTNYIQCGTTRNKSLWDNIRKNLTSTRGCNGVKDSTTPVRIALTVESMKNTNLWGHKIPFSVDKEITSTFYNRNGLRAIPDYKNKRINLYIHEYYAGGCVSIERDKYTKYQPDCSVCYKQKKKCFMRIP